MPSLLDLSAQRYDIGKAAVFYAPYWDGSGNLISALANIGVLEGPIAPTTNETYSDLKLDEQTGDGIVKRTVKGSSPSFEVGVFPSTTALSVCSATGSASGGTSRHRAVKEWTIWVVPEALLLKKNATTGIYEPVAITFDGADFLKDGEALSVEDQELFDQSRFYWKGHWSSFIPPMQADDGGKSLGKSTWTSMLDFTKPEGHMLYTTGADLAASGIDVGGSSSS